jgi:23S rRNA (uracil1939-C5)-methyltransferase
MAEQDKQNIYTVTIDRMVYGGEAMGRLPDGRAVFIPFALPREKVDVRLTEEKRGHARGEIVQIIEESPDRISTPCGKHQACGGCHYQHIPYDLQIKFKKEILKDQLERIGKLVAPIVKDTIPSPKIWRYRNQVQFHINRVGKLGYYEPGTNRMVSPDDCPVAEEAIEEIVPQLKIDPESWIERVSLRVGIEDDVLLILEGSEDIPPEISIEDLPISAVYIGPGGLVHLAGSEYLVMEVLGRQFKVSAESFFQVNTVQTENLVKLILSYLPEKMDTFLELYSGVGLFSAFIAPKVSRLAAVEFSERAVDDFGSNLDEYDNVEVYQGKVEEILPHLDISPDAVLIDPPRAGLGRKTLSALLAKESPLILYVSCDPATLARDARYLVEGGYRLKEITPIDMFPQTYHIECVALMSRVDK